MNDYDFIRYMNKFNKSYRIKIDEDGMRIISKKNNIKIAPYDPDKKLLGLWIINMSKCKKTNTMKKLLPLLISAHQDCESEIGTYFHEENLSKICSALKITKRRYLTEEKKEQLIKTLANGRLMAAVNKSP